MRKEMLTLFSVYASISIQKGMKMTRIPHGEISDSTNLSLVALALPVRTPTGTSRQENRSHTRWGHLINAKYHPTPARPPLAVPPQERGNSAKE